MTNDDPGPRTNLTRRQLLTTTATFAAAAAAATLASGFRPAHAQGKISQEQAQYQPSPKGDQQCAGCRYFLDGNKCEKVEGEISPSGWCSLYRPKS